MHVVIEITIDLTKSLILIIRYECTSQEHLVNKTINQYFGKYSYDYHFCKDMNRGLKVLEEILHQNISLMYNFLR